MKASLLFLAILFLASCNLNANLEHLKKVKADMAKAFVHENINITTHWGTNEEDDRVVVYFYEYPVNSKTMGELENLGAKVTDWLLAKEPDYQNKTYIEVLFTKETYRDEERGKFYSYKRMLENGEESFTYIRK